RPIQVRRISSASSPTPPLVPGGGAATGWLAASGDTSLIATLSRAGTSSVLICCCPMSAVFFAPGGHTSPSDLYRPRMTSALPHSGPPHTCQSAQVIRQAPAPLDCGHG